MTLKFIQDIKNQIEATMPDNTSGQITPAILRAALQDMCDSLYSRAATLYGSFGIATPVSVSLTTAPTVFPTLMPLSINNNPTLFTTSTVASQIAAINSGYGYSISISAVFSCAANVDVYAELYVNGVANQRFLLAEQGTGAGEQKSVSKTLGIAGIAANSIFELRLLSPQGPVSVAFASMDMAISLNPTLTAI